MITSHFVLGMKVLYVVCEATCLYNELCKFQRIVYQKMLISFMLSKKCLFLCNRLCLYVNLLEILGKIL